MSERKVRRDRRGVTAIEFALVAPLLVGLTLGLIDFALVMLEFNQASEATRRATRVVQIEERLADISDITAADIVCTASSAGVVSCSANSEEATADADFATIITEMQDVYPVIGAENVKITYSQSGVGDPGKPGGRLPLVTIEIIGLIHTFTLIGSLPGVPAAITVPGFPTTVLARGNDV
ncbi:MAG: pilus assembly protein [Alphaproteobacteria bacterium]|jgi:hypothetical protein|nr:pilus assembly protein [Alphaproteobacteria bacterium]